jgi:hypothetical protein
VERTGSRPGLTPAQWGIVIAYVAAAAVGGAVFPRLAYRLRWRTRLGPRGLLVYAACDTLYGFAVRQFLLPTLKRIFEEHEQARDELRERLGREPTDDELGHFVVRRRGATE